jgi:hypothetical protein
LIQIRIKEVEKVRKEFKIMIFNLMTKQKGWKFPRRIEKVWKRP